MLELTIDESDRLITVAHALASEIRISILKLLNFQKMNIIEIAEKLDLPVSTIASNIKVLEVSGLINTELQPATRGKMKVCSRNFDDIYMLLNLNIRHNDPKNCYEIEMPIGHYVDCEITPTCGIINQNGVVQPEDDTSLFYHPERISAQLIWLRQGFLEYRFPLSISGNAKIESVQFSMELCSEAPHYDHNWPSDITVWINGKEICTWTSPGDFGDRRGKLNPTWLRDNHTQYGLLKNWKLDNTGSYLDAVKVSSVTLSDIEIHSQKFLILKVGVKSNAVNVGGINLFGKGFGDHNQDILMRIIYS
ncbi:ArsR/SmtB family transcription factor [Peribacillus muralis]|uniref:ArsR/SmtB family transcription factor n=1 Tax=Peribacillus muralis TaxID=264697 RepID=UPI00367212B2